MKNIDWARPHFRAAINKTFSEKSDSMVNTYALIDYLVTTGDYTLKELFHNPSILDDYECYLDDEADAACARAIADSLWAFRPSFILGLVSGISFSDKAIKAFEEMASELCEDMSAIWLSMLGFNELDEIDSNTLLVEQAIAHDGRGHFLSQYDGVEQQHEFDTNIDGNTCFVEQFYIYRTN